MRILIGEDDPEVVDSVSMAITFKWPECEVATASTATETLQRAKNEPFDLLILDVNFPDGEGFDVLEELRGSSKLPVIMLTVRASEREKVKGLELGADDYVAKPFSAFELLARACAVIRRASNEYATTGDSGRIEAGRIRLKPGEGEVIVDERPVRLTPTEFNILEVLARHAGNVVKPASLLKEIWGISDASTDGYLIKLHMKNLRRKLGENPANPQLILTVRGFGYKLAAA